MSDVIAAISNFFEQFAQVIADLLVWAEQHHLAEWALAFVTLLLFFATWRLVAHEREKRRETNRRSSALLQISRVSEFDPSQLVGAFRAADVTSYLDIPEDAEIQRAFDEERAIVIAGRPGIGKSHAAVHQLLRYPNWYIARPSKRVVSELPSIRIPRCRYILVLDDLHEYLAALEEGQSVLDLVNWLQLRAKELRVIATIRNTFPEFESLKFDSKLLQRWRYVELKDWPEEKGLELAQRTHRDMAAWDGTPLSVKQPSVAMAAKYRLATIEQKAILRSLKFLRAFGIKPVARQLLRQVVVSAIFNCRDNEFERELEAVASHGFLKRSTDVVEAYDPYLDTIADWVEEQAAYPLLREIGMCQ